MKYKVWEVKRTVESTIENREAFKSDDEGEAYAKFLQLAGTNPQPAVQSYVMTGPDGTGAPHIMFAG